MANISFSFFVVLPPLELPQAGNTREFEFRYYFRGNSMSKRSSSLVVAVPFDVLQLISVSLVLFARSVPDKYCHPVCSILLFASCLWADSACFALCVHITVLL